MPSKPVAFVFGDRPTRPRKSNRTVEHILGDIFTTQGFIGFGIILQAIFTCLTPPPYTFVPGALFIALCSLPTIIRTLGLSSEPEDTSIIVGKTATYLDFADPSHAGKQPGAAAMSNPDSLARPPVQMALMLIGSQCHSTLGALQPEFKEMGDTFAGMIKELRAAPPEDNFGFLNAEFYMHGGKSSGNSNMVCIYFRSYDHIMRFTHRAGGTHWPAWNKFLKLRPTLSSKIGIWHEVYEIANAEAVYHNMPRLGLGDMWDAVRSPNGQFVYRNPLVVANGSYASSDGRMGVSKREKHAEEEGRNGYRAGDPNGVKPCV